MAGASWGSPRGGSENPGCQRRRAVGRYWSSYGVPAAARYLTWLAEHTEYGLSDIEAEVAAHASRAAVADSNEPGAGPESGPDEPDDDGDSASTGAD